MTQEIEWWDFEDKDEMADAVAGDIAFIIESALDARGQSLVAFPGDAVAHPVFEKLAEKQLRWRDVTIVTVDDRLVPVDSSLSHVAKIARIFMPLGARVMPISSENEDVALAGNAADARLQDLQWPPDLVWLTSDSQGNAAGILPGPDYEEALDAPAGRRAVGLMPDPMPDDAPVPRVTLTAPAICEARTVLVTISGDAQKAALDEGIEGGEMAQGSAGRIIARLTVPIDIYWLQ